MSDYHHLTDAEEYYGFYLPNNSQTIESPSTTASSISPTAASMQYSQNMIWQTPNCFDSTSNNCYYPQPLSFPTYNSFPNTTSHPYASSVSLPYNHYQSNIHSSISFPTENINNTIHSPIIDKGMEPKTSPPSPKTTPLPSPELLNTSKRKRKNSIMSCKQKEGVRRDNPDLGNAKDRNTKTIHFAKDGADIATRREDRFVKSNTQTVDQLENELAFLRDECATILINLGSLRNAFLAQSPPSASTSTNNRQPLMTTLSFTPEEGKEENTKKKQKSIAQNPEMEREMRIAYDDLMLQVRQVEKKIETLEAKSKEIGSNQLSIPTLEESNTTKRQKQCH
ncbi:hypothetical protein CU098_005394 [Rhizopus stolonifer]|uniref:Uncharacterized protein n=1 Tax=Rhizopus stolonifer TaxID=4846 RepID=A0A367J4C4_RHIST|nr:hypothetical protein CU098_005394 [Rhizopus stolonifer]